MSAEIANRGQGLPGVIEGKQLISPQPPSRPPSYQEQAGKWAKEIRQVIDDQMRVSPLDVLDDDVEKLKQELVALFIVALQQDNRPSWSYLNEVMTILMPYREYLQGKPDMYHYLERVIHHVSIHQERLYNLGIVTAIRKVFPQEVKRILDRGKPPTKNYTVPTPPRYSAATPTQKSTITPKTPRIVYPDGKDPFRTEIGPDEAKIVPKPLTFGDLRASLPTVAMETANRESLWGHSLGLTVQALSTDLLEEMIRQEESRRSSQSDGMSVISEERNVVEDAESGETPRQVHQPPPMTGREAVEFFTKCYHTGKIRFMYFNLAPNRHYRPYDLVSTHKLKAQPEHYVFSTFGVLHVHAETQSESMSLTEWQREAVLWEATSTIPFFKNYLLMKMFRRWKENIDYKRYTKHVTVLSTQLLSAVPIFGAGLLQLSRLLQELLTLKFLPMDDNKTYELDDFENLINYKSNQAEKFLEKFYRYARLVLDTTNDECCKKLRYCEAQAQHKTVFTKDSLHLQRMKKEQRDENLRRAREEMKRLPDFMRLVHQIVLSHLVQIARANTELFVQDVMKIGPLAPRDGLFQVHLIFSDMNYLTISPNRGKFTRAMSKALSEIPGILCEAAEVITDGEPLDRKYSFFADKLRQTSGSSSQRGRELGPLSDTHRRTALVPDQESSFGNITDFDMNFDTDSGWNTPSDFRLITPNFEQDEYDRENGDLGVATPDLVVRYRPLSHPSEVTNISGTESSQLQPLSKANLEEKLKLDKDYRKALKMQEELMHEALVEIEQYCEDNSWLSEIHQFCRGWTDKTVLEYRSVPAFNIEQKLNEIRQWTERVRNFDHSFKTTNGLVHVSCHGIHDNLVPKLNHIYKEMVTFIAREARKLAQGFVDDMNTIVGNLKEKDTALDRFAKYSKNVQEYKKNMITFQQRSDYIKSLFEVIRMCYRQLKPEEEKLEEQVQTRWEAFLYHIQDANEFLSIQTPLVTSKLEDTYKKRVELQSKPKVAMTGARRFSALVEGIQKNIRETKKNQSKMTVADIAETAHDVWKNPSDIMKLEEEANRLCTEATSGQYLDPNSEPAPLIKRLKEILHRFYSVKSELIDIGRYKEDITGETYDTSYLRQLQSKIEIRTELWKYLDVSANHIMEWKMMLFKKMSVKKVYSKVNEWQAAAVQIKKHVPVEDRVLIAFYRQLQDFKQELPLLYKLSSDALKPRHWKAIFIGMGESYDPLWNFTVNDLLAYNLGRHSLLINTVYQGAVAEYDLEQKLNKVKRLWEEKEFKLAKHIPDSVYDQEKQSDTTVTPRKLTRVEKFRQERARSADSGTFDVKHDDMFTLIEVENLKYLLEDSSVTLQSMLVSPYLAELRPEAERWAAILDELEEIVDLWHICQKKWLYLLKVFEDQEVYQALGESGKKFKTVNRKFKDFMMSVTGDHHVMSVVSKKRGEKGFKLLSGDVLKDMFRVMIQDEEEILIHLGKLLEKSRHSFPRLYFLSDEELVDLLGISRNPRALVPYVQKCFPGIESLSFALPESMHGMHTALDLALNAHVMEVTAMHGIMGETVPLVTRIEAVNSAPKWLDNFETSMKTTMATILEACVLARLDEGATQPHVLQLLDEVAKLEEVENGVDTASIKDDIRQTFEHWLLRFPGQTVLVAEGVLFEQKVHHALQQKDVEELEEISESLRTRIEQYSRILHEISADYLYSETKQRLHVLLGNLINQAMHYRDVIQAILDCPDLSETCYDWSRVLKYHMDMTSMIRAKTEVTDDLQTPYMKTTVGSFYELGPCLMHQLGYVHLYDHEYLGLQRHLVFTPLTERAYLTLSIALKNYNCGTLMGPSATGKTQTIKDLAQSLGRHLVTVNCSATISIPTLNQYLHGIIQAGSWVLFDDCDRLDKGVMSVFSQHLDYLRTAYRMMDKASQSQYKMRGKAKTDQKVIRPRVRRHSVVTLHPMPGSETPTLERQATVPHGFNEQGLRTYFEDTWIKERERRHSIGETDNLAETELYPKSKPPPLFQDTTEQTAERIPLREKRCSVDYFQLKKEYQHTQPWRWRLRQKETKYQTAKAKVEKKYKKVDYRQLAEKSPYKPAYFSNVMFDGKLVQAKANYGCFMTLNTQGRGYMQIPDSLKHQMRPCALISPDIKHIIEMSLYCYGFTESKSMTTKLFLLWELMQTQLPRKPQYCLTLRTLKTILALADRKLHSRRHLHEAIADAQSIAESSSRSTSHVHVDGIPEDTSESPPSTARPASAFSFADEVGREEYSIIYGVINTLSPKMEDESDLVRMKNLVRDVFPQSARPKSGVMSYDPGLVSAIQEQMAQDSLQATTEHVNKILQLYSALQMKQGVLLLGPSGCGKTTSYQTLARALNTLHSKKLERKEVDELKVEQGIKDSSRQKVKILRDVEPRSQSLLANKWKRISGGIGAINYLYMGLLDEKADEIQYPKVALSVLTPNVFTTEELFGYYESGVWHQGIIAKLIKEAEYQVNSAKHSMENFDEKKNKLQLEPPDFIKKWLVMDGGIQESWVEGLNSLLDDSVTLSLANRETAVIKPPTSLLFEMNDLENASPAMLTRCALVHLGDNNVHWKSLVESWGIGAKQKYIINSSSMRVIIEMSNYIFTKTLKIFSGDCCYTLTADTGVSHRVVHGVQEVTSFLNILSSLLDRHYLREDWEKMLIQQQAEGRISPRSSTSNKSHGSSRIEEQVPNYVSTIKCMFAYAYIWSFGGILNDKYMYKFDELSRDCLARCPHPVSVPRNGSVFDYHIDMKTGCLVKWEMKQEGKARVGGTKFLVTVESEHYSHLLDLLLSSRHPVLLTGAPGVGKSSLIENVIQNKHPYIRAMMSPGLAISTLQTTIMRHVTDLRRRKGQPALPGLAVTKASTNHLFFLDDLNSASKDKTAGIQRPLEFLRQLLTYNGIYDKERAVFTDVPEVSLLAACTAPGSPGSGCGVSRHILPPRLARLFNTVTVLTPSDESLHSIYGRYIRTWLEEFPTYSVEHHAEFSKAMTQGMLDLYKLVRTRFRPTPTHAHYVFSLHDIAHVIHGILLMSPRSRTLAKSKTTKKTATKKASFSKRVSHSDNVVTEVSQTHPDKPPMMRVIARLWCHEVTRVFSDRLSSDDDMVWFKSALHEVVNAHFCSAAEDVWKSELLASIREETLSQIQTPMRGSSSSAQSSSSSVLLMTHTPVPPPGKKPGSPDSTGGPKSTHTESRASTSLSSHSSEIVQKQSDSAPVLSSREKPSVTPATMSDSQIGHKEATPQTVSDVSLAEVGESKKSLDKIVEDPGATDGRKASEVTQGRKVSGVSEGRKISDGEAGLERKVSKGQTPITDSSTKSVTFTQGASRATSRGVEGQKDSALTTPGGEDEETETESSTESETESDASEDSVDMTSSEVKAQLDVIQATKLQDVTKPDTPGHLSVRTASSTSIGAGGAMKTSTSSVRSASSTRRGGRRGVTFKSGLVSDHEEEEYLGPLFSMDQIKESHEDLTGFLFTKSIMGCYGEASGKTLEKGYLEVTSAKLEIALKACLKVYNEGTSQKLDLVFFNDAIQHITRLSRVLTMHGGNALLLGISYCTGRATMARLAAYIGKCKLFEAKPQQVTSKNQPLTREMIKRCCQAAGLHGRPSVLLIHEGLGMESLRDVCALMKDGTCPNLYTEEELLSIIMQMLPGFIHTKRVDKIEQTFEKFRKRVLQNIHVVVCLNYTGTSQATSYQALHEKLKQLPDLLYHSSCVDLYQPWSHDAFTHVARQWLQDTTDKVNLPWSSRTPSVQVDYVSHAMSYIHESARRAVEQQSRHMVEPLKCVTPLTYMEFSHLFRVIAACLVKKEKANIAKHEKALEKITEAEKKISSLNKEKSSLAPRLEAANKAVEGLVKHVEEDRAVYIKTLDSCRQEEKKIEELMGPLSSLKEKAQAEFDRINPIYYAAVDAMEHLSVNDYYEVKSFNAPPKAVKDVVGMICIMFGKQPDWETGKLLLMSEGFFNDLIFFDKDDIPAKVFKQMGEFVSKPEYQVEAVAKSGSLATSALCSWVHSIHHYGAISQSMKPRLAKLLDAEGDTKKAQAILGAKRVEASKSRTALEQRITAHKEAVKHAKGIEKHISKLDEQMTTAENLMENMSMQNTMWNDEVESSGRKIETAVGDALLAAGCACYFGPLNSDTRAALLQDWLERCEEGNFDSNVQSKVKKSVSRSIQLDAILKERPSGTKDSNANISRSGSRQSEKSHADISKSVIPIREDFCLEEILSSFEEQCEWRLKHMPSDLHAVQNALIMRVCCQNRHHVWPLLIDPDRQAKKWVKMIQKGKSVINEHDLVTPPIEPAKHSREELAPSRGAVVITPSDVTDQTLAESVSLNESTSNISKSQVPHRVHVDDLRPVTTVMTGEVLELTADTDFTHPRHNLWVVEADDPSLDNKMVNAIIHGVTVLVTNIERRPLDPLFRSILLRQFSVNDAGEKVVCIGERELAYHPDFNLYLSTAVPLYLHGDGITSLPIQKMCVIDLSISQEGVANRLLTAIMKFEKPEFEGQKRALEGDIIHQKHDVMNEQEKVMGKTLDLEGPLLADKTMLDSLLECQENVNKGEMILDETEFLQEQLETKKSLYVPVATNGSMVYTILHQMAALKPIYHIPLALFTKIFSETIDDHQRGKFSTGVPKGRTQELIDATTAAVFKFISLMMSQTDAKLFALVIAMETMKSESKMTSEEYRVFVEGLSGVTLPSDCGEEDRPSWMDNKTWVDCVKLESTLPVFEGLTESFKDHSTPWKEYFQLPVALMNLVPDDNFHHLNIFQKVLIWKFACPHRLSDVCEALSLHQLGGMTPVSENYDLHHIYPMTSCNIPVVFILPPPPTQDGLESNKGGFPLIQPSQAIQQLSKQENMPNRVVIVNLGTPTAMSEAQRTLELCVECGDWLVIQNTHLADEWPEEMLKMIRSILTAQVHQEKEDMFEMESAADHSTVADGKSMMGLSIDNTVSVHRNFRLWVVGYADKSLPGVLSQYSLKVNTSLSDDFKNTIQRYYTMTEKGIERWSRVYQDEAMTSELSEYHLPLTLLQSVLLHRRAYGAASFNQPIPWSHADYLTILLLLRQLLFITRSSTGILELVQAVYSGPCLDEGDREMVMAAVSQLVDKRMVPLYKKKDELPTDLSSLLSFLEPSDDERFSKRLEELVDINSRMLGLSLLADHQQCAINSSTLANELTQLAGSQSTSASSPDWWNEKGQEVIQDAQDTLDNLPELPETSRDHLYPMEVLLHYEVVAYKSLLATVQTDLNLLTRATQGETSLTPEQEVMYLTLLDNQVPRSWETSYPSCLSLKDWFHSLETRIELVTVYAKNPSDVAVFNLAVFHHPDRFIQCLLQNHSRKNFRDLHTFKLELEFLPMGNRPVRPPASGVYIEGLRLHNASWDGMRSVVKDRPTETEPMCDMPVIWLKPVEITEDKSVKNQKIYRCPVYLGSNRGQLSIENVVTHLDIPTVAQPTKWSAMRVYLSCALSS